MSDQLAKKGIKLPLSPLVLRRQRLSRERFSPQTDCGHLSAGGRHRLTTLDSVNQIGRHLSRGRRRQVLADRQILLSLCDLPGGFVQLWLKRRKLAGYPLREVLQFSRSPCQGVFDDQLASAEFRAGSVPVNH